ncbi:MAG: hypothetical protein H7A23_18725 [Leptospiraceae bacterium]|nr:hypothetical protein [Leptospiraceae bacterium]
MPDDYPTSTYYCGTYTAPTISNLFSNTLLRGYWSSSVYSATDGWISDFGNGATLNNNKTDSSMYVRCVSP